MAKQGKRKSSKKLKNKTTFTLPQGMAVHRSWVRDAVYAEPSGYRQLAHCDYQVPTSGHWRAVDFFVRPRTRLNGVASQYPIDPVLESKTGLKLVVPRRLKKRIDVIRGIVAAYLRNHLGDLYQPDEQGDREKSVSYVSNVKPAAQILTHKVNVHNGSKQVRKKQCLMDFEADLSRGCIAATTIDGYADPNLACGYCYGYSNKLGAHIVYKGSRKQFHQEIKELTRERQIKGKSARVVCLGMIADPGHPAYREELVALLQYCIAEGLVPVVRSKFLEFDEAVADLLKLANGVLVISLGNDVYETGACGHGRPQSIRITDAHKYSQSGVNVVAGVVIDPAQANGGPLFAQALQIASNTFKSTVLYALRARGRERATVYFGDDWETRKAPDGSDCYERDGSQYLAKFIHPTIRQLIGKNGGTVRLCLKNSVATFCGGCHVPGEKGVALKGLKKASPTRVNATKRRAQ